MEQTSGTYELFTLLALALRASIDDLQGELVKRGYTDLRPTHGFAFQRISHDGATGSELAEYLAITKQAASQMVEYLEKQGYITRQPHPRDGREKLIVLTDRGWACTRAAQEIIASLELRCANLLGVERMQMLRVDLYRLALVANHGVMPTHVRPIW